MKREDDFESRRASVANLSDKELEQRFWSLAEQIVDPLLKLGYENTSFCSPYKAGGQCR